MKIKNQERIMGAVKAVLDAENTLAAVLAEKRPKRETKKAATAHFQRMAAAHNAIDESRRELRRAHTEIVHEEYGQ